MATEFLTPGVTNGDFETRKDISLQTVAIGQLSTLKEFQDKHQQIFFTPALPYVWFYEKNITFDPLFSDLPDRYAKHIRKLSLLPLDIVDGFYGDQAYWNRTLWTIHADLWEPFCKLVGGKGYFDSKNKLVVLFGMGLCNAEDVLAKVKGRQSGFIPVAHIGLHTNKYSIVMSESVDALTLSLARTPPDRQLQNFAEKFFVSDSSAVNELAFKHRGKSDIAETEICSISDLSRAQKKKFIELKEYYEQVFDGREATPSLP